jgi:hypothetical protein
MKPDRELALPNSEKLEIKSKEPHSTKEVSRVWSDLRSHIIFMV